MPLAGHSFGSSVGRCDALSPNYSITNTYSLEEYKTLELLSISVLGEIVTHGLYGKGVIYMALVAGVPLLHER